MCPQLSVAMRTMIRQHAASSTFVLQTCKYPVPLCFAGLPVGSARCSLQTPLPPSSSWQQPAGRTTRLTAP